MAVAPGQHGLETLQAEGCDTSQVQIDKDRLTAQVLLGWWVGDAIWRHQQQDGAIDATLIARLLLQGALLLVFGEFRRRAGDGRLDLVAAAGQLVQALGSGQGR